MTSDFTKYTDSILSSVSMHFQLATEVKSRRTGRPTTGNFLPILYDIFQSTQESFSGLFTDFSEPEKIFKAFREYVRMVAAINGYTEFSPTRTNFCAFLNISTSMYANMLKDSPQNIRDAMCYVEDYFVSTLHTGSLQGELGSNAAKLILQTAGQYGHSQVTVKEASDIRATERRLLSPEELEANLKRLTIGK